MNVVAEKWLYALRMMHLTGWLASLAKDEYSRDVVLRHSFVYLDAFIELGQRVKNLVKASASASDQKLVTRAHGDLKQLKEDYRGAAGEADENGDHLVIRTKLTAHRQDVPIERRLALLWDVVPEEIAASE